MANTLFRADERDTVHGALPDDLLVKADDFALTMASKVDARFWVRAERQPVDGALVVTDFAPGASPLGDLAAGLAILARVLSPTGVAAITFRDLVPAGAQAPFYPARMVQAADLARQLGDAVAERLATAVAAFEMRPCHGKIDARVTFGPAQA